MNPMRVLHVIPGIAARYGGPSAVIGPLCQALNALPGMTAEIATTDADGSGGIISESEIPSQVPTHLFKVTVSERWKLSIGLWNWLRRNAREYDLIHIHALWSFATAAAAKAARRSNVPYIIRPAGMLSSYTWQRGALKKQLYWSAVERRTVFGATAFHATSDGEAREIKTVHPAAPTFVIPNGIDPAAWSAPRNGSVLRRMCGPHVGQIPIVLFLSRLHPKKGVLEFLLPAMAQLRTEAFLAIAGGADDHAPGYASQMRQAIDRLDLDTRVAMLGPISPQDRWSLFDGAAVFVLPSHSENFGLVVTEAMSRGCPVIVSTEANVVEHVQAARAGRSVNLTVESVANAIEELLGDSNLRLELGERGADYAKANLDWAGIARQVADMYSECLTQLAVHQRPAHNQSADRAAFNETVPCKV
jgi:glycosyltransferase involved in cell wall biosynthesis